MLEILVYKKFMNSGLLICYISFLRHIPQNVS